RCDILNALQRWDDAIRDCTRAIQQYAQFDAASNGRGFAYAGKGNYAGAIQDYDQPIRHRPTKEYLRNRGEAYPGVGGRWRAKIDFDRARKLPPDPITW